MSSNMASIGFDVSAEEVDDLLGAASDMVAEEFACPPGFLAVARYPSDSELWVHIATSQQSPGSGEEEFEIVGFTPFHQTDTDVAVKVEGLEQADDDNAFEGRCEVWIGEDEAYPMFFELVDYPVYGELALPLKARASIISLAKSVEGFEDEEAFYAEQENESTQWASNFFIPVGKFVDDDGVAPTGSDMSMAWFAGTVISLDRCEERSPYLHIKVETLSATYDIFAAPEIVTGPVVVGGIVRVAGLMFGRLKLPA